MCPLETCNINNNGVLFSNRYPVAKKGASQSSNKSYNLSILSQSITQNGNLFMDDKLREVEKSEDSKKPAKKHGEQSLPEIEIDTSTFIDSLFGTTPIKKSK